ncbi:MAG: DUF2238 domain-containing protein [Phycisphaerae bacterium]|nr:DUF2238 domain-containing protein [Phycisphaerae bacterium]MDD5380488.1 DUF2238 domain-containing protein [Phycisphaerae bacterium]
MKIRRGQLPILIVNLCAILSFGIYFIRNFNYEFVIYVGVIAIFLVIFVLINDKVYFPNYVLWLLTLWALMHMAGGSVHINGTLLYKLMLVPLSKTIPIFCYDQLVHIIGFGTATVAMYYLLRPLLRPDINGWWSLSIILILAGLGAGAFNETVEFLITLCVRETKVGGYMNTSLDLVSNFIGSIAALLFIRLKDAAYPVSR